MTTSPASIPDNVPTNDTFPFIIHSTKLQPAIPAVDASTVLTNANITIESNVSALPVLNPNQPNHTRMAPIIVMTKLCGGFLLSGFLDPSNNASTSPDTPEDI